MVAVKLENLKTDRLPEKLKVGKIYSMLTIEKYIGYHPQPCGRNAYYYECLCECGNRKTMSEINLINGNTKSCGCFRKARAKVFSKSHGDSCSKTYNTWASMKQRCLNKNHVGYSNYGGRGITICKEWLESYDSFLRDMGQKPSQKHSLDRIDNEAGYSKDNCRWALISEQVISRRDTIKVLYKGEITSLSGAARMAGVNVSTAKGQRRRGLPIDKIIKGATLIS